MSRASPQTKTTSATRIHLWYGDQQRFGRHGRPQRAINLLGHVDAPDGLESLVWHDRDGESRALSIGPDGFRLERPGDFNVEIPCASLQGGCNDILIAARWRDGTSESRSVQVDFDADTHWPLPYHVDFVELSLQSGRWQEQVQVVDGRWALTPTGLRTASGHYDRLLTVGDRTWTDYRTRTTVVIHRMLYDTPGDLGGGVGLLHRWSGHVPDAYQPHREWRPNGAIGWYRADWEGSPASTRSLNISDAVVADTVLTTAGPSTLQLETPYIFEFGQQSRPGKCSLYRFRVWPVGAPGQLLCDLEAEARAGESSSGSVLLIALFADISVQSIDVTPLGGRHGLGAT